MASGGATGVLLAVGAELAVVAFLVILAGDFPEPVAAFVALLWLLFLINRAGTSGAAGGTGSLFAPGANGPVTKSA